MRLDGAVALVTGAAHRLGAAVAHSLAGRGCSVVVHYGGSREAAERTAAELARLGVRAWPLGADLREPAAIEGLLAEVASRCGRLDLLVNSAASFERQDFETIEASDWDRVLALNLRAPLLCARLAAPLMRSSQRPDGAPAAVVNIADLSAFEAWPGYAHHGVSKAGLVHLTRQMAVELAPAIRANAVVPGAILPPPGVETESPAWRRRGEKIPLGRTGRGEEVGAAVVFLAANDFVTGAVLPVDGGEGIRRL